MEETKITIFKSGNVNIEGDFPVEMLIGLLRKELVYQEELERIMIKKQIKEDLDKNDSNA